MRSWMIGLILGMLPVLLLPRLPGMQMTLLGAVAGLSLLVVKGLGWRLLSGSILGCCIALLHGQLLLERRLPQLCEGQHLTLSGTVASLPRTSYFPDGRSRQRFELDVQQIEPRRCAGPERVLLSYY